MKVSDFWVRTVRVGDCIEWQGPMHKNGYGVTYANGDSDFAHRVAYELANGDIPDGLQIDHLCRNKRCVNPDHLEAVSPRINTLRGVGFAARNAAATHCIHGHPFTPENTRVLFQKGRPHPRRKCKTCDQMRTKKYRNSRKEGIAA